MSIPPTLTATDSQKLADLPNEVIGQIFECLIPRRSTPNPFKYRKIKSTRRAVKVDDWDKFIFISGNEPCTHDIVYIRFSGIRVARAPRRAVFSVLAQPSHARTISITSFANFAATCRRFSSRARELYTRRSFILTVSNHGVVFEGLRNAFPLQTFAVLPEALGSVEPTWAMVDPLSKRITKVPRNTIPGNVAFRRFSAVFKDLHTLRIHTDIDMEQGQNKKTAIFLSQIGGFLLYTRIDGAAISGGLYRIPSSLRSSVRSTKGQPATVAEACLLEVSTALGAFMTCLQQFLNKHNARRNMHPTILDTQPLKLKISVDADGKDGMLWGAKVVTDSWGRTITATCDFGSFEGFCEGLQHRLFDSSATLPNQFPDLNRYVCQLGLPLPS
ncbi:hypothetical protein PV08_07913 [Exophiala spinifera]|uniref:Uncharacterized protein n=1 Tax=Exophiala spinifera TaxID=91928 RepID=A0A0D1YJH7_9EURO|nr:uncharacterized protein PV08_07913 [Exophiala spinifera]KIW15126.1 hypothetical protein PV08_07913 [Exophiala spinifera]